MTDNPFDCRQQVVLVAGGAGLLGSAICTGLDDQGATVVVADRDRERGQTVAADLDDGTYHELDVTDPDSVSEVCDQLVTDYGRIDGLVNTTYPRNENYGQPFEAVGPDDWNENVQLHLGGCYHLTREVALRMLETETAGSIVNFGSIYGVQAPDFTIYEELEMTSPVEYAAIKAGIIHLTRYLASYLGPDGIRVNAVSPGGVFNHQNEQFVDNYTEHVPLGRMANPGDVVGAVIYLLSDAAGYVTGHNLVVDGGWTIQ